MSNQPIPSKPTEMEQPASKGSSVQRLVVHLLKYGGCWILALIVYVCIMWMIPWKCSGTPWAVLVSHGVLGLMAWILYGMGGFDGDP